MKNPSLTLLALAVAAPAAYALDLKDEDVKLGLALQLQIRAEWADAEDKTGASYNVAEGTATQPDAVDFYVRRARFGVKGSYKDDYKFAFVLRMDQEDKATSVAAGSTYNKDASINRRPEAHQVYIGREFKQGNLTHYVQAGLDYAFFNGPSAVVSSNTLLFVNGRSTEQAALLAPRGVGVKYKLTAPYVTWGVDIQNNVGDSANTADNGEGLCYTTRVHITPENEWKIAAPAESFLGKPGKGVLLSAEYGKNVDDITTSGIVDITAYGFELYGHWDAVSALAEYRSVLTENQTAKTEVTSNVWLVQAGYAMPCPLVKGAIVEPAIRFQSIDLDADEDKETPDFGSGEYGASGTQIDVGVNYYLNNANTKFALDYANWTAEDGDAKAQIIRAQLQLYF